MKIREPVARPLDVVAVELLLSAAQAFLVGVLMYLAVGVWTDRGVGLGSVAVILALLGLAIGGSWLYWLLGGVGWPMAAANVPAALFLGFALVLGWAGDDLFRVAGVPLLLAVFAAVYGVVGGVFIESPRRWRWDQRLKPRPGTVVPRVSETTQTLVAAMPRSLPKRAQAPDPSSDLAARIEHSTPPGSAPSGSDAGAGDRVAEDSGDDGADEATPDDLVEAADVPERPIPEDERLTMPSERLNRTARETTPADADEGHDEPAAIELPTSIEPMAQRSPWAWAAPPAWNRDEDDEQPSDRSSRSSRS